MLKIFLQFMACEFISYLLYSRFDYRFESALLQIIGYWLMVGFFCVYTLKAILYIINKIKTIRNGKLKYKYFGNGESYIVYICMTLFCLGIGYYLKDISEVYITETNQILSAIDNLSSFTSPIKARTIANKLRLTYRLCYARALRAKGWSPEIFMQQMPHTNAEGKSVEEIVFEQKLRLGMWERDRFDSSEIL